MSRQDSVGQLTAHLFREHAGKMSAVLSRMFGLDHVDMVQDIVQDAFEAALRNWRFTGVPRAPEAWLMQVAKNKAINRFRRDSRTQRLTETTFERGADVHEQDFDQLLRPAALRDSQLRLLLACCQPPLQERPAIQLTLHLLCGFGVPEIAAALIMGEDAVKKSLSRSKAGLRAAGRLPHLQSLSPARTATARTVLYLMFNEGYKTTRSKEAINRDLCFEAVRLAKLLDAEPESEALLALMFFNLARFPARLGEGAVALSLEEQDRSRWDRVFIEEGCSYLRLAVQSESVSRYHIEAIIASLHCLAPSFEQTDWKSISTLYRQLEQIVPPSPVIRLNRVIAESHLPGADGIAALETFEGCENRSISCLVAAARGDVHRRAGRWQEALPHFEQAHALAISPADRAFLRERIMRMRESGPE